MELGRVLWEARTCSRQNRYNTGAYTLLLVSGQSIRSTIPTGHRTSGDEQVKYPRMAADRGARTALQCPQRGPSAIIGLRICGDQWNPLNYSLRMQLGSGQN